MENQLEEEEEKVRNSFFFSWCQRRSRRGAEGELGFSLSLSLCSTRCLCCCCSTPTCVLCCALCCGEEGGGSKQPVVAVQFRPSLSFLFLSWREDKREWCRRRWRRREEQEGGRPITDTVNRSLLQKKKLPSLYLHTPKALPILPRSDIL